MNKKKENGKRKYCKKCNSQMIKYGKTVKGKQRWFCKSCKESSIRKRKYVSLKNKEKLFLKWILNTYELKKLYPKKSRTTLWKDFKYFWDNPPKIIKPENKENILILDSKFIQGRKYSVHISTTTKDVYFWSFYEGENYQSWNNFISKLPEPNFVIIDGHGGILKAIKQYWPSTRIQRCIFHIIQRSRNKLTSKPKYQASKELRKLIVNDLINIKTEKEKIIWIKQFRNWEKKYSNFLNEKTYSSEKTKTGRNKWWYSHKTLRGVRSHINMLCLICLPILNILEYQKQLIF